MTQLTVHLAYRPLQSNRRPGAHRDMFLPVKALDEDGSILTEGAAGLGQPALLSIPDATAQVFVRLTWPSGRSQTQRISLDGGGDAELTFTDESLSSNEWAAWAIPRLNARNPLSAARGDIDLNLQRFDNVWLRLWRLHDGVWQQAPMRPDSTYRNGAAWQLDLTLEETAWLLQLGGSKVPWRFVSLPGGGPARVLFTPKDSSDHRSEPLEVVVTSFRSDAETLLEFLARDSMRAADALACSQSLAHHLFAEKFEDPISAVAGAYYSLRGGDWERIPRHWYENLSRNFRWLPDASIVHCVRLLREGAGSGSSNQSPFELLEQSLQQGWPVFEEGVALLQEAAATLRQVTRSHDSIVFKQVQALRTAKSWAGAATSFFGDKPDMPTSMQWVGMPNAPRRLRLDPPLSATIRDKGPKDREMLGPSNKGIASTTDLKRQLSKSRRRLRPASPSRVAGKLRHEGLENSEMIGSSDKRIVSNISLKRRLTTPQRSFGPASPFRVTGKLRVEGHEDREMISSSHKRTVSITSPKRQLTPPRRSLRSASPYRVTGKRIERSKPAKIRAAEDDEFLLGSIKR